jgi:S1-C subfamily serine protease
VVGDVPRWRQLAAALCVSIVLAGSAHAQEAASGASSEARVRIAKHLKESTVTLKTAGQSGSGFVGASEGWIVTNSHVVWPARFTGRVQVMFGDGEERKGRVLLMDEEHDLALVEVEGGTNVPPLRLGDSSALQVGESVLAFGSPYGLDATLTSGVVSALRDIPKRGRKNKIEGIIQTDAPINPGSSGGPLVSARGEVVGVNTAIYSRSGGNEGIGFAVPTRYVHALLDRARGKKPEKAEGSGAAAPAPRVSLGARVEDYDRLGYTGVRILSVISGGAAQRAGLRGSEDAPPATVRQRGLPWTGHIILAVNGDEIQNTDDLKVALAKLAPGEIATLTVTVGPGARRKVRARFE